MIQINNLLRLATGRSIRKIETILCTSLRRNASTYEGDGKTTGKILNKEMDFLLINSYSNMGFALNNGIRLIGPSILFPRSFLSWNIGNLEDVNENSLSIFTLLYPKIDLIVLGFGDLEKMTTHKMNFLKQFSLENGIGMEILPTDKAVTTFNFLNHEKRYVAGAFIPPTRVDYVLERDEASLLTRQRLIDEKSE